MKRVFFWSVALLLCGTIIALMNNRFVQSMIYPAPAVRVSEPPPSFTRPAWDLEIDAWLHEPEQPAAKQVLLYFHGNGENLETLRLSGLLDELQAFQIPFLAIDYPGYGRSKGTASEESILRNSAAAVKWLRKRFPDHRIILCGWSLGASVAVQTAKQEQPDALIAMSTWTSLRDVAVLHFSDWLVRFALRESYDALQAAKEIQCPVLMIHGELDDLIPAKQGEKVAAAMKTPPRWVLLPSVSHNDLLSQPVVWNEIAQFLKQQ